METTTLVSLIVVVPLAVIAINLAAIIIITLERD
jgi:hypothetical protein